MTRTPIPITLQDRLRQWIAQPMSFYAHEILLEDGRPLGQCWDAWQREDFLGIEATPNALLIRPRGHSKTGDAGTVIVHDLICAGRDRRVYSVAADQAQADLLLDDVITKFQRNPRLAGLIKPKQHSVTVRATGNTYATLAADVPGAFGLRPDLLVVDELAEWPSRGEKLWHALWSATGKKPHTKTMVISSPGGDLLAKHRDMARGEANWFVSERGQCASWIAPAWLAQQRKSLPDHVYQRLHEGRWVEGEGAYLTTAEVARIFTACEEHVLAWVLGVDLGLRRDRAVVAAVGITRGGHALVDHLYLYTPSRSARVDLQLVEAECLDLAKRLQAPVVIDPWQGILMADRLRDAGVFVIEHAFTSQSRTKLFARLLDVIRTDQLRAHPHPIFERELLGLQIEAQGAGWRVDHAPSQHDDTVIAVGLALAGLHEMPSLWEPTPEDIWPTSPIPVEEYGGNLLQGPGSA